MKHENMKKERNKKKERLMEIVVNCVVELEY